jgi:hypothetical protein
VHIRPGNTAALTAMAMLLASLALIGGSSLRRVTRGEFQRAAKRIGEVHTAHCASYIGTNGARAYIEHWRAPLWGSGVSVLWTPISELPAELAGSPKAGRSPWERRTKPPVDEKLRR